jgi:hypothetical protein
MIIVELEARLEKRLDTVIEVALQRIFLAIKKFSYAGSQAIIKAFSLVRVEGDFYRFISVLGVTR